MTVIVSVPAGVFALFVSNINDQASDNSIAFRIVVLLHAVIVAPLIPAPAKTAQQLSATVVTD